MRQIQKFHFLMEWAKYEFRRNVMPTHAQVPMHPDHRSSVRSYTATHSQPVTAQTQFELIMENILVTALRSFLYVLLYFFFVFSDCTRTCYDGENTAGENTATSPTDPQCYVFNECHSLAMCHSQYIRGVFNECRSLAMCHSQYIRGVFNECRSLAMCHSQYIRGVFNECHKSCNVPLAVYTWCFAISHPESDNLCNLLCLDWKSLIFASLWTLHGPLWSRMPKVISCLIAAVFMVFGNSNL